VEPKSRIEAFVEDCRRWLASGEGLARACASPVFALGDHVARAIDPRELDVWPPPTITRIERLGSRLFWVELALGRWLVEVDADAVRLRAVVFTA
jgi:hypothetical protein